MGKSSASINLLHRKKATSDVILDWALTSGRFIIIITETIALLAFAYRFTLDRQIIDLHDKIKQNQAIVYFYKDSEVQYRTLQAKLATLSSVNDQTQVLPALVNDMISEATNKVILQSITVTAQDVQITANTPTIALMNSYIDSLKKDANVLGVDVTQVENKPDTGMITLSLDVSVRPKKGGPGAS